MLDLTLIASVLGGAFIVYLFRQWSSSRHSLPLPPGPKPLPLIGNVHQFPAENEHFVFEEWGKTYGDIMSVNLLGKTVVILNSAKAAIDLLDKRSDIYSERPYLPMGGELVGWDHTLALVSSGDRFRQMRKYIAQALSVRAVKDYRRFQTNEARASCARQLITPENFIDHIRRTVNALILSVIYGYPVSKDNDPLVVLAEQVLDGFSASTLPGAFLVDVFPLLKHVPAWFPGAGFQRKAAHWRQLLLSMVDSTFTMIKKDIAAGTQTPCLTSRLLDTMSDTSEEETIKWAAASAHTGGADTSVSALMTFYLAMTLNPAVQQKAQAEIDAVVGNGRLPEFEDRENLPYTNALLKEVLRWKPVTHLNLPHVSKRDDVYEGYHIPKGSIILANIWVMNNDPSIFKDPRVFRPERFLEADGKTPVAIPNTREWSSHAFGFGRRLCPGQSLADETLFMNIATTLATLNISKALNEKGVPIEPSTDYVPGVISRPKPWVCKIEARSSAAADLLKHALETV